MILVIDNYDSFTFNLVHYLEALKQDVLTYRNDELTLDEIKKLNPSHIVLSPGPGRPEDAGITLKVIHEFTGKMPILGVCLGHQAIALAFGAKIINAQEIRHGKISPVYHLNKGVFKDTPNPLTATRYHSLMVDEKTLSSDFQITAWTKTAADEQSEIMGIKHKTLALEGVQFHPESILTVAGYDLLNNFISQKSAVIN